MKKLFTAIVLSVAGFSLIDTFVFNSAVAVADDIDKILKAKDIVRSMVNYPDTLVFHEFYTKVRGNTVTLKFTCKNGYGVPETHIKDIVVN